MADDETDPGGPPPVMLNLEPAEEPDPDMILGAELVTGAIEEGRTEGGRNNQNWLGGLITVIILIGLLIGFRGITQGNLALMVASAIVCIVIPVALFVGVIGWRAGSANNNTKGEKK